MKVFGSVSALKKSVEKTYDGKIAEINDETRQKIAEINGDARKKLDLVISKMQLNTDAEVSKTYSKIMSEETMGVKKEFETTREALINKIFDEVRKQASEIVQSKKYVDLVKESMPKEEGFKIIAGSKYFSKYFPGLEVEKGITGVKFVSKDVVYDLTLDAEIASKRDLIRHKVSNILFGSD